MRQLGVYRIFDQAPDVLRLDDGKGSSFYLLEGKSAAVLIDTGMADEPLRPVIEKLTVKPVTVLITHGHGDHMRHAEEFDRIYIGGKDIPLIPTALKRVGIEDVADVSRYERVEGGETLAVGEMSLRVLGVGGHSPGSMVFYEPARNLLFTGDALGSGAGVWMQLAGCLPLTQYRAHLRGLLAFCGDLPQPPVMCPGHAEQRHLKNGVDNPVCRELVCDMITLCTLILEHREARVDAPALFVREKSPVFISEYGRASIVYSEDVIA